MNALVDTSNIEESGDNSTPLYVTRSDEGVEIVSKNETIQKMSYLHTFSENIWTPATRCWFPTIHKI